MAPTKPTILIVPGAACPIVFYEDLVSSLRNYGYETETHNLRSYTDDPIGSEPEGLHADAAFFHEKIESLVEQGKDVVVVGHSYGGLVVTDAAHGLTKSKREHAGKTGGVVRLVYLSCIVGEVGKTSNETTAGRLPPFDFMVPADPKGNFLKQNPDKSAPVVFNDLPKETAHQWISKMYPQSVRCYDEPIQHAAYKDCPVTWILCLQDETLTPSFQRGCIEMIEAAKGQKIDVVEMNVGHCPNVSATESTAKVIAEAAVAGSA